MKINHPSWKSVTLAVTASLLMSGIVSAAPIINVLDVIAVQKQFVIPPFLTGCRLAAADVNGDSVVDTVDVIAVQRYFLGFTTGIANTGLPGGCDIFGNTVPP